MFIKHKNVIFRLDNAHLNEKAGKIYFNSTAGYTAVYGETDYINVWSNLIEGISQGFAICVLG